MFVQVGLFRWLGASQDRRPSESSDVAQRARSPPERDTAWRPEHGDRRMPVVLFLQVAVENYASFFKTFFCVSTDTSAENDLESEKTD